MNASVAFLILVTGLSGLADPPAAEMLEQRVIGNRLRLESGRIVLLAENVDRGFTFRYEILFDGESRRLEITRPAGSFQPPPDSNLGPDAARIEKYIVTPTIFLYHIVDEGPGAARFVAHARDMQQIRYREANDPAFANEVILHKMAFDPRIIGIATQQIGVWWNVSLTDSLLAPGRSGFAVTRDEIDGLATWKEEFSWPGGIRETFWIAPERDYNVKRAQADFGTSESPLSDHMSTDLRQYPCGDELVWFPSEVRLHREIEGKKADEWVLHTESAEFNQVIDPAAFTLSGLDMPTGTLVAMEGIEDSPLPPEENKGIWDGTEVRRLTSDDVEQRRRREPPLDVDAVASPSRWITLLSINAVIAGALLLFAYLRKSS